MEAFNFPQVDQQVPKFGVSSHPVPNVALQKPSNVQNDSPESQIVAPMMETSSALLGQDERKGKGGEPTPENIITGVLPSPTKDILPTGLMNQAADASSPTLILGGFSIMVMPMPKGANMQQFIQQAPTFMSMLPTGR